MWSTQKTLSLIEDIRCSPCLWDMRHADYRNRTVKADTYEMLGRKYCVCSAEIVKKFQILRTQFRREHKRVEGLKKASQWFGYEPMLFLNYVLDDDHSEDQIFVSLSDCESSVYPHHTNMASIKRETLENDLMYDRFAEEFENSTSRNMEVSIVGDSNAEQLIPVRYAKKSMNRSSLSTSWDRDEFAIYGEHIANKLRNCGRSQLEIAVAQHEIDNICFKLTMGAYREQLENVSSPMELINKNDGGSSDGNVSSATAQE